MVNKKYTIQDVKQALEAEGYKLVSSEYVHCEERLDYLCPKGHRGKMRWITFRRGSRCHKCAKCKRLTIQEVTEAFEAEGYTLLSVYSNNRSKLKFKCPHGHNGTTCWMIWERGHRCAECAGNKKYEIGHIKQEFEKEGYILLSPTYEGALIKLAYTCPEGHTGSISWTKFQSGHRCPQCREWKGEKLLKEILQQLFPDQEIRQYDNLEFLNRQTVDFSIREKKLAFEYDGRQHFEPVCYGGMSLDQAEENFNLQQEWDQRKKTLCSMHQYHLIRIAYNEELTLATLKRKIEGELPETV